MAKSDKELVIYLGVIKQYDPMIHRILLGFICELANRCLSVERAKNQNITRPTHTGTAEK